MRHFIKDFTIENQIFVYFYTPGDDQDQDRDSIYEQLY